MKYIKEVKDLTSEELDNLYWKQIEEYGAPIDKILEEEAKKFNMSIDEFLSNEKSEKRVKELEDVFGVMLEPETTLSSGGISMLTGAFRGKK